MDSEFADTFPSFEANFRVKMKIKVIIMFQASLAGISEKDPSPSYGESLFTCFHFSLIWSLCDNIAPRYIQLTARFFFLLASCIL